MKKWLLLLFSLLLLIPVPISAQKTEKSKVLILYSSNDDQITSDIQILNTQVGHFTNDITIKNIKQLSEVTDKSSYTHVIYMGEKQEELSTEAKEFLESFPGPLLVLGQNIEQLSNRFSFITLKNEDINSDKIEYPTRKLKNTLEEERSIKQLDTNGTILAHALRDNNTYPLIVQQNNSYYVATSNLFDWISYYIGESLFSYFQQKPETNKKLAYLKRFLT